jgi:hypothetical protein
VEQLDELIRLSKKIQGRLCNIERTNSLLLIIITQLMCVIAILYILGIS